MLPRLLLLSILACGSPAKPPSNVAVPTPSKAASIAVQLAYKGTFFIGPPFSHVPPFTLLDDGTLILAEKGQQLTTTRLSRDELERIVRRIEELGFARLESHPEHCKKKTDGNGSICVSDDTYTILRVLQPSGTLREIVTYSNFSNEPEIHQAIVDYFEKVKHPATTPYHPAVAVLHVQPQTTAPPPSCRTIDPALLHVEPSSIWGRKIMGAELDTMLRIVGKNLGSTFVCANNVLYQLTLLPGVPGSDLDAELEIYRKSAGD